MILFSSVIFLILCMKNNCSHISEYHLLILEVIGEEKALLLAEILGKKKISFYEFIFYFRNKRIMESLKGTKPVRKIARENSVHVSTIYRIAGRKAKKRFSHSLY